MIETTLNRQQAEALFTEKSVFFGNHDVIFAYMAADLFGRDVCAWAESEMKYEGYFTTGEDHSVIGSNLQCIYFYKSGFFKLVYRHNYILCSTEHNSSAGGQIWDELWAARCARLEAEDAEEERKHEERKAKRAEARRAKQAAAEQAAGA